MKLLKPSELSSEFLNTGQSGVPLIICTESPRVKRKLDDAGYKEIQINTELSKKLLEFAKEDRPTLVEKTLKNILNYHEPIYITRFEMLFDPRYEIDILKLFCEKARLINVAIKWPGKLSDGKLIYAEPEDPDYHEFDCSAYQIRIVL